MAFLPPRSPNSSTPTWVDTLSSVESFQPSPSLNVPPNFKAERTTHETLPLAVRSPCRLANIAYQPSPSLNVPPNFKAERTTHESLPLAVRSPCRLANIAYQPSPSLNVPPNFKAERTTHESLATAVCESLATAVCSPCRRANIVPYETWIGDIDSRLNKPQAPITPSPQH